MARGLDRTVRHTRPVRRAAVLVATVVLATLVGAVGAVVLPPAEPASALTIRRNNLAVDVQACALGRLHQGATIATCGGVDMTSQIRVNGADVGANQDLAIGDVVTVSVTVHPRGGHDAMYAETIDSIRNNYFDIDAVLPITLPTQTGSSLSQPTNVSMSRTDNGDRGSGPLINCWLQSGSDAPRNDGNRAITLGAGPVGNSGMKADTSFGQLVAQWTSMTADRCVDLLSNNGFFAGHTVQFSQTVLSRGAAAQTLSWTTGGLTLALKDRSRSLTWGDGWTGSMRIPAASAPSAPFMGAVSAGNAQATVSWTPPTSTGGSPLAGYVVVPMVGEVELAGRIFFSTATTQVITGLTNGTAYRFKVNAFNSAGNGPRSGPSDEVTPKAPATIPGRPGNPFAVPGDGEVSLSWDVPTDIGGAPVTGYWVIPHIGGVEAPPARFFNSTATTQTITGLTNGTAYAFRVAAVNSFGIGVRSIFSNAVTPSAPASVPDAPTIGTAIAGNEQVSVYWSAPASDGGSPITGYVVTPYIGGVAQTPVPFASTAIPQVVQNLTNDTAYTFTVAAVNAEGTGPESAMSNSVTPSDVATRPGPPVDVMATAGVGSAIVSWDVPSDDGGLPITGYVVTPYIGTSAQTPRTYTNPALTQTVTGLVNGTTYTFRVAAVNALGTGSPSAPSNPVTPLAAPTVPGAPTIGAVVAANAQVNVSWTAPVGDGGSPITGYVVTPYIGGTAQTARTFTSTETSQVITGLANGTGYRFRVAAVNAVGTGAQSSLSTTATPFAPVAPGPPTIGSASAGDGQATVSWSAPASNGGSPITGYSVTPYIGATAQTARTFTDDVTTQVITGLTNGTSYTFRVAAINAIGTGNASAASNAVTPTAPASPPGAPTIGTATAGNASATVRWTAPASNGGAAIVGYVVVPYIGGVEQAPQGFASTAVSQVVTGLTNGTAYTFRVRAVNEVGAGSASAASNSVTPTGPPTAPGPPTIGSATAGNAQATVSWTAPASSGGSAITGYLVTPYIGASAQTARTFTSTATSQVITGLTNGTTYTFKVAATNAVGTGTQSAESNSVTPAASVTAPGAPTIGSATAGNAQATVSWTAPASNGGSAITGYVVTPYIGASAQTARTFTSTATSQVITGLTNGTTYTFKVAATNAVGTGAQSGASNAVTPSTAPTAPGAPTIGSATAGNAQATVSWTAPASNGGSAITGYVVTPYIGASAQTARTFTSTATSQVITGLTNGTTYTFKVAATNAIGTGAQSAASGSVTPTAPATAPGAPTIGLAVAGNAQATVSWTAPASNGGSAVTGYVVTPYVGSTPQAPRTFTTTATTRVITGLTNGTSYTFRVAAVNAVGIGAMSAASNVATPTAAGVPPFATIDAFTTQQFRDLAGRNPTTAELTAWRTAINGATKTPAQLIEELRTAAYWDGTLGPIVRLYRAVYLRNPDTGGMQYWESEFRSGRKTLNQIANFFAVSPEFRTLYGNLSNGDFVTKVYQLVLGREPSTADLDYWTSELERGQPRGKLVLLFSSSAEYKAQNADRVAVVLVYFGMLRRVGTTAETNAALAALEGGGTIEQLVDSILGSTEYADRF